MAGIFGNLFDFNHDGKMDTFEKAAEMDFIMRMSQELKQKEEDSFEGVDNFDDDTEDEEDAEEEEMDSLWGSDVNELNDDQMEALADAGVDLDSWEYMDDDEKMETMEDAGIDNDWGF